MYMNLISVSCGNLSHLRVFRLGECLDGKVVKCFFNDYPEDENDYELQEDELQGSKVIIRRHINFSEIHKRMKINTWR